MSLFLWGIALLLSGGTAALFFPRRSILGAGSAVFGCVLAAWPALQVLAQEHTLSLRRPWQVPYGAFFLEIDALSAVFLLVVLGVCGLAALYGWEYHRHARRSHWFFYNLLVAAMALVLAARNGILFLVAWETMALTSFFLVTEHDQEDEVRKAGRTYLIATHLATGFLLALFALLGRASGSLDFDRFLVVLTPALSTTLLLLGLVGFGAKAGLVPLHVWLPEAHPAAPSHVSAVMSGAMINLGIYGLLRTLTFLGAPPLWWGGLLIGVGLLTALFGALLATAQHDLKRLLAYSTIENAGIITIGIGVGVVGLAAASPLVAVLGFAGALLAMMSHAIFKSLLFLGAGTVAAQTGTRRLDQLGGLFARLPVTGTAFLVGAATGSALPPFSGFVGEFLIFLGALRAGAILDAAPALLGFLAALGLALAGGLATAAMIKAFGIAFLGQPRTEAAARAVEAGPLMRFVPGALGLVSVLFGLGSPWIAAALNDSLETVTGLSGIQVSEAHFGVVWPLIFVTIAVGALLILVVLLAGLRRALLSRSVVTTASTWSCGYAMPTARMQYTGSSLVQPLVELFRSVLPIRQRSGLPRELYPQGASFISEPVDAFEDRMIEPAFRGSARALAKLRWLQHGRLNLYLLYVALTLLVLLVWKLG